MHNVAPAYVAEWADVRPQKTPCPNTIWSHLGWKVQMLAIFRLLQTWFPNLISSFSGIDFKMKTLLIDGIKVRVQIW